MKSAFVSTPCEDAQEIICTALSETHELDVVSDTPLTLGVKDRGPYEVLFVDLAFIRECSSDPSGQKTIGKAYSEFCRSFSSGELIVLSEPDKLREAVSIVKAGASSYLTYPIDTTELQFVLNNVYDQTRVELELDYLRERFWKDDSLSLVRTNSSVMQGVYEKVRSVAPTKTTVLLTGETGTGKGVLARLIHMHSTRSEDQFIGVHCGAIPDTLLESELFGHEKGAFTGAHKRKRGRFEIAQGGSIFLDEIATVTTPAQIKLLQVLQDRSFQRVGGEDTLYADVRIIAASNQDLGELVSDKLFRSDLYYRLNVFPIELPPLRERVEDIPLLAGAFLANLEAQYQKGIQDVSEHALEVLAHYEWPGNIRELENLIERAYILESSNRLMPESFPSEMLENEVPSAQVSVTASLTLAEVRREGTEAIERSYLKELLATHAGKINVSADAAGVTPRQLNKLMNKYGIRKEDFKNSTSGA